MQGIQGFFEEVESLPLQAPRPRSPRATGPVAAPSLQRVRGSSRWRSASRWRRHHRRPERQELGRRTSTRFSARLSSSPWEEAVGAEALAPARQALFSSGSGSSCLTLRSADGHATPAGSPARQSRQSAGGAAGGHAFFYAPRRAVDRTARARTPSASPSFTRAGAGGQHRDHRGARSLVHRIRRLSDRDGTRFGRAWRHGGVRGGHPRWVTSRQSDTRPHRRLRRPGGFPAAVAGKDAVPRHSGAREHNLK